MADIINVFDVYQFMNIENIIFAYTGTFEHFITTVLLKSIKNELKNAKGGVDKKVYNVVVESIENISKYSPNEDEKGNSGILLLCKAENKYIVITGNVILNKDIPMLKDKLEKISKLDREELKQAYREQIASKRTHENRAGLGIIDIALKSGNNMKYDFQPNTENTSFYLFQTEINIH